MPKIKKVTITAFLSMYGNEASCRAYLYHQRWPNGFVCPHCGGTIGYALHNGHYQCADCRHQASLTAGTVMHRSHLPLTKWFLAFYLVSQDKRGISATQLCRQVGTTYKAAWYMLKRIRSAMGQRDDAHKLSGIVEFDDTYLGAPTTGQKRGRGTAKAKIFVALSLDEKGRPQYLKMKVTENIKSASVKKFARSSIEKGTNIRSDGYRSYPAALADFTHEAGEFDPTSGLLHWLHIVIGNAKAFILGTYHGLPKKNLQAYLDEFCYRFSRRFFKGDLFQRLTLAAATSKSTADLKG